MKYFFVKGRIMAIKLLIDSGCDMRPEELPEYATLMPIKVYFNDEEYTPYVNLSTEEFYEKLSKVKELPHTSQINAQTYCDYIKPILDNGDEVLIITMSGELSGTVNSARLAKRELNSDKIAIVDSKLVTFPYRALIVEAMKMIEQGMPLNEIENSLNAIKEKIVMLAVIDDLKYLRLGGRIGAAGKALGDLFAIKPILTIKNGVLEALGKSIGIKKGLQSICDMVNNASVDDTKPKYIGHSNCVQRAEELKAKLIENTNVDFSSTEITEIGATVGTHAGPGCTGVVFFVK